METFIVAVSGGVDSVVLLDKLAKEYGARQLVVAHFDHGIRPDSAEDAQFVKSLAENYGARFETRREELGEDTSEEFARNRRYAFLRETAKKYDAQIMTAHHGDDIIETIAINLIRGTGWRGLAVLDSPDILRPLLGLVKEDLVSYAETNRLQWREDSTNADTKYLRNAIRLKLRLLDEQTKELLRLYYVRQCVLKRLIDAESKTLIYKEPYSRYFFGNVPANIGTELLRTVLIRETGQGLTRPQIERLLLAIKTQKPGKTFDIDAAHVLQFTQTDFVVRSRDKVVS